ncbi:MAG: 50S ribosomal protein L17 [Verrucomicrobiota bacterium]|jgi:large subunit ribosomal protein L17|nr:50S ribosomal protein L17 [Verrucomicrobiota bacterium]
MRHRKNTVKLGRTSPQREALFASLVSNLILAKRIKTTLPKARAAKRMADKMVTLGKKETLAARRQALSQLKMEAAVAELFSSVAPAMKDRRGGYTRIVKLGKRMSDSSEICILEWVDFVPKAKKAAGTDAKAKPAKTEKPVKAEKSAKAEKPATKKTTKGKKEEAE